VIRIDTKPLLDEYVEVPADSPWLAWGLKAGFLQVVESEEEA
jgi:hypothetical protein